MTNLNKDIAKIKSKYPYIQFSSHENIRDFVNIHNILESVYASVDPIILFAAFQNKDKFQLNNPSDYYYLVTSTIINESQLKKVAYPLGVGGFYDSQIEEVNINKWVELVHKIHQAVEGGTVSFSQALDHYSKSLNIKNNEDEKFKKWVLYYKNGEHQKYAKEKDMDIKKESDFQFGLNSSPYGGHTMERDVSVTEKLNRLEDGKKNEAEFDSWKTKVNGAIRRIDKLLRNDNHLSPEEQSDLADMLHSFDLQMRRVRMRSTASDISFKTATSFKKVGYNKISEELTALAQDLESDPQQQGVLGQEAPNLPPTASDEPIPAQAPAQQAGPSEVIGRALVSGEEMNNHHGDVFDQLAQSGGVFNMGTAAVKLEEVAARLADRRTIRQLAEFDIMLDKLGIASLFPELAEAQSKLIDAYSYALVRVTKMLGMLSSGRSMNQISDAKKTDISNRAVKEVNKTFEQDDEPLTGGKGTEALNKEFGQNKEQLAAAPEGEQAITE